MGSAGKMPGLVAKGDEVGCHTDKTKHQGLLFFSFMQLLMEKLFMFSFATLVSSSLAMAGSERFVSALKLPSGQTVVVAEGDFEARSIGSFSVRLYAAAGPENATTFFTGGMVLGRDGTIERVTLADIDADQKPEIIIVMRSAGSGGYLSAQAIEFDQQNLKPKVSVEGLASDADPIAALILRQRKK